MVWTQQKQKILKRWQKYTEELYKKDLHDPDYHNGLITHLEPEILECEIKWASASSTMTKASGGDGTPVELFQILKDDAVEVLHSICQQIWKTQQWLEKVSFMDYAKAFVWIDKLWKILKEMGIPDHLTCLL